MSQYITNSPCTNGQCRAAKSRSLLLKLALGLGFTSGLFSPIKALAESQQGSDNPSQAMLAINNASVAIPEEIVVELNRVRTSPAESGYVSFGGANVAAMPLLEDEKATGRSARAGSMDDPTWFGDLSETQLSTLSEELIEETNKMRTNPAAYAQRLEAIRDYYEGNLVKVPGRPALQVVEGVGALDEAIAVLKRSRPLGALVFSPGMSFGANDHATDLGSKGITGHYGSDGSDPFARISRYGEWHNRVSENISYGQATIAEWHLINLLVDDNVPSRGHRQALLEPTYSAMGAACHEHSGFRIVCVMNYASDYQEKPQ